MQVGLQFDAGLRDAVLDAVHALRQVRDVALDGRHARIEGGFAVGCLTVIHHDSTYYCQVHSQSVLLNGLVVNLSQTKTVT